MWDRSSCSTITKLRREYMKEIFFDDGIGSRERRHINLLLASIGGEEIAVEFKGESISGVCQVLSSNFHKNGKWSKNTWKIHIPDNVVDYVWCQDFGTGQYVNENTWGEFFENFPCVGWNDALERFVRIRLLKAAERMDKGDENSTCLVLSTEILRQIRETQEETIRLQEAKNALLKEAEALENLDRQKSENQKLKEKLDAIKGKKLSLEELKAALS